MSSQSGPTVPVIYNVSFQDPAGYFLATKMQMRDKDIVFAANAASVQLSKFLALLNTAASTADSRYVGGGEREGAALTIKRALA